MSGLSISNSPLERNNAASSSSSSSFSSSSTTTALGSSAQARPKRRVIYIGIKRGRVPGVYVDQKLAEEQVIDYPSACLRWFSTRYAAEAYISGWPWKGELIPKNCPYPLREYLNMTYPNPAYQSPAPSIPSRPASQGDLLGLGSREGTLSYRASSATLRPPLGDHKNSWRNSMVKAPSPLRHQVDEQGRISIAGPSHVGAISPGTPRARSPAVSLVRQGGIEIKAEEIKDGGEGKIKNKRSSIFGIPTFSRKPSAPAKTTTQPPAPSASGWKDLPPPPPRMELRQSRSDPNLLRRPQTSHASSPLNDGRPRQNLHSNRQSGLWADTPSPRSTSISPARAQQQQPKVAPAFADTTAPAFSRSALRRSGVIMPAPASHIPSPRRSPSTPSLSPSSSTSSISSVSSTSSSTGSSFRGITNDFIPPRAGFMRRPSSLSLSSTSSCESIATITGGHNEGILGSGYSQDMIGGGYKITKTQRVTDGDAQQKKEKEKGMMRGLGKIFGMKKRA